MVYYLRNLDNPQGVPSSWEAFWDQAEFMLELVRCDLEKDIQSYDEAIKDGPGRQRDDVIRFRKSDDQDQVAYFHDLGRTSLELVAELVESREWTPTLAHHWSVLMFAHGFLMPSAFAIDDDLSDRRRGIRGREATSREAQRRWYSHYLVREFKRPLKRAEADDRILRLVDALIDGTMPMPAGFTAEWFQDLKDGAGIGLSSTLEQITRPGATVLAGAGKEDLPPLDLPIP